MPRPVDPRQTELADILDELFDVATESAELRAKQDVLDAKRDQLIARATELGGTRRQVADAALVTRARVQQIVRDPSLIYWLAHGKTKGPGDDPSGLERAARRRARADQEET